MRRGLWGAGLMLALAACPTGAPCDPSTCNGCCLQGACVLGDEDQACGRGGYTCADCAAAQRSCQAGACVGDPAIEGRDCAHPLTLSFVGNQVVVQGDTGGGGDGAQGSCGGAGAPERIYLLQTVDPATLQAEVRPASGSALRPVLSLKPVCGAPGETVPGCVPAAAAGEGAALTVRALPAGSWYLTVGGLDGTSGPYTLNLFRQNLGGESCTAPLPLNFPAARATTLRGTLAGATGDVSAVCGGSGPDLVYTFATGAPLNLEVALATSEPAMVPVAYLRGVCSGGELACTQAPGPGEPTSMRALELVAGAHLLMVDSASATGGPFELRASLATPPVGASCFNTDRLALDGGRASALGSTVPLDGGFPRGAAGSCGGQLSGERVYRLATPQLGTLRATATPLGDAGQTPLIYLRRSGCAGNELSCRVAPAAGAPAVLTAPNLPPDVWFLFVDGLTEAVGDYALEVELLPPLPGDTCTIAEALFPDGGLASSLAGSTSGLFDDLRPGCDGNPAPDRVFTFTTTAVQSLRAAAAPLDAGFRPLLSVRQGSCLSSVERVCGAAPAPGERAEVSLGALSAGTWYLWVDGAQGTSGDFVLDAALTTPLAGESCANAEPLFADGGTQDDVAATLQGYAQDGQGSCGGSSAPDRAYSFTTSEALNFRARLTPAGGETGVLYLRSFGCTSGERQCRAGTAAAGGALVEIPNLPLANHTLWVDSLEADAGSYTLSATLSLPQAGDACTAPRFLSFAPQPDGGSLATASGDTTLLFGHTAACSGSGPDEVFSFVTAAPQVMTATVTPLASGYWPTVSVRSSCTSSLSTACGAAPGAGQPASISVNTLPAGTWYLWVDGAASRGPYTLQVELN